MSQATETKAHNYLIESRIKVIRVFNGSAFIEAHSPSGKTHDIYFHTGTGWECDCPAQTECSHILAAKLITDLQYKPRTELPHTDGLDKLFEEVENAAT